MEAPDALKFGDQTGLSGVRENRVWARFEFWIAVELSIAETLRAGDQRKGHRPYNTHFGGEVTLRQKNETDILAQLD
jgi:hypothetical protein